MEVGGAPSYLALSPQHTLRAPLGPRMGTCESLGPAENRGFRFAMCATRAVGKGVAGFLPPSLLRGLCKARCGGGLGSRGGCCAAGGARNQLFLFSCNPCSKHI